MKIGINTWVWTSPFGTANFDLIPKIKQMGYDIIEVAVEDPDIIDLNKLKAITHDNDLSITLCGAFGPTRDISNEDENIREIGKKYIIRCIKMAEFLGCNLFSGPVYSAVGKARLVPKEQRKREWEWCVNNLREISSIANDSGVVIGIEPLNRFETDMINLVDQAVALIEDVGSQVYKVHIDMFHSNIEEKSIPDAIRKIGKLLCHIHACENDRGTPGSGHQDWSGIKEALTEIGYEGAAVIESFTPGVKEISKAAAIWRPLAQSQDKLAEDGAIFLKRMFK